MKKKNLKNLKTVVLIDTENVCLSAEEVQTIKDQLEIVFFVSGYSNNISLTTVQALWEKKIELKFEKVDSTQATKNNLDFHIVAYLAMQTYDEDTRYYILSKDNGYRAVSRYISSKTKLSICVIKSLNEITSIEHLMKEEQQRLKTHIDSVIRRSITNSNNTLEAYRYLVKKLRTHMEIGDIAKLYKEHKGLIEEGIHRPLNLHNRQEISTESKKPLLSKNKRLTLVKQIKHKAKNLDEFKKLLYLELSNYETDLDIETIFKNNINSFNLLVASRN